MICSVGSTITLDLKQGFHKVPGYPPGFSERIIAGSLDEKNKVGNRTRILRIEPGAFSTVPFVHTSIGRRSS